jgi:DNA-directed RNA polymerase specialized sigma24 family protein
MSGRTAVAEDVAQETFMALIAGADLRSRTRFLSSYLYGIARRVLRRLERGGAYVPMEDQTDDETSGHAQPR